MLLLITETQVCSLDRPRHGGRNYLLAGAISLLASLVIVTPFFLWGSASGHDFEFHVGSWLDAASQWKEGIAFPRWTEWANHGFGEPRFIFYPPASWMLGAALSFVLPWSSVPAAFIVLTQTLAGLGAFQFARRIANERAAICAAACYAANPYALLVIYMRSDYAELLAAALLPAFFLTALELTDIPRISKTRRIPAMASFAAVFAAIWLCNAPAAVLASYTAALLFAWAAVRYKSWRTLIFGVAGVMLGIGLASFYLLPAAYEQRWVNIGQVLSTGLLPSENFLYTATNDPEHNLFNWIASSVAVLMIVLTGIAAIAEHRKEMKERKGEGGTEVWKVLLAVTAVGTLLMMHISAIVWNILPKLRFVQFPWRWMAILAVPFAYFIGAAMANRRIRWGWAVAVAAILAGTGWFLARATWWDADDVETLQAAVETGQGFEGTDEYDPAGDDHYDLPSTAPPVKPLFDESAGDQQNWPNIVIDRWTAEDKEIEVDSRAPVKLALRLLAYPAWQIRIDGKSVRLETEHPSAAREESQQMIVPVPAGSSHISVRFSRTVDRTSGGILTLVSAAVMLIALLAARLRRHG